MNRQRSSMLGRVGASLKRGGVRGFAADLYRLGRSRCRWALSIRDYYIYRYPIPSIAPHAFRPEVERLQSRAVASIEDVTRLVAEGVEDPRMKVRTMERRLAAGAVAMCIYVGTDLGYVGWMSTCPQAKRSFDRLPYRVAFDEGEAATGGAWTVPAYRGLGLYRYGFGCELHYLKQGGSVVCCNAIAVGNIASQRGQAVYGARVRARARCVRVLGVFKWTECPMSGPCPSLSTEDRSQRCAVPVSVPPGDGPKGE